MASMPIRSPLYFDYVDYPSHVRGPNYTRYAFHEYGPKGNYQPAPIFVGGGRSLAGDDQYSAVAACKSAGMNDEYCQGVSRSIGSGQVTAEEAVCELKCLGITDPKKRSECIGGCYAPFYMKLVPAPVTFGLAVVGALALLKMIARKR